MSDTASSDTYKEKISLDRFDNHFDGHEDTESLLGHVSFVPREKRVTSVNRIKNRIRRAFGITARSPASSSQVVDEKTSSSNSWEPIDSASHAFVPGVEGLRGIAVTFTVTCHSLGGPQLVRDSMGSSGVTIFFVLSGFLITAVLMRLKAKSSGRLSMLYRFYSDRFFRLTPGLFFMMGCIYFWYYTYRRGNMDQVNRYTLLGTFYLSNQPELWWPGSVGPFPHLWSLACEEQFYIIWSSLIGVVLARGIRMRLVMLILPILASISVRAYVSMYPGSLHDMHYLYALSPNIYKMLLGSSLRLIPLPKWFQRSIISYIGLAGIFFTVYLTSLPALHYEKWAPGWNYYPKPVMMWADMLTAMSTCLILCGLSGHNSSNLFLELSLVRFVGRISYAWYLWQIPILFITNNTYRVWPAFADSAAAFLAAAFSTIYVEEPINRWYKSKRDKKSRAQMPVAS